MSTRIAACILIATMTWSSSLLAVSAPLSYFSLSSISSKKANQNLAALPSITLGKELDLESVIAGAYKIADQYDPALYFADELLEKLDFDPVAAFAFVRDQIRFDPYQGILRGPEGVLGGKAGNAYDRSLLLKQLLEDMGFEARLTYGTLSKEKADKLFLHALTAPASAVDIQPLAKLAGFTSQMQKRMQSRAQRDYYWLKQAIGKKTLQGEQALITSSSLTNHVWVQARLEGDKWIDLDSSFPDAKPGERFTDVLRYAVTPSPEDRQTIELRVISESLSGSKLLEKSLLELKLDASSAARNRIYLSFVPTNAGTGGTLTKKMGAASAFKPIVTVDGEMTIGKVIPGIAQELNKNQEFLFGGNNSDELTALYLEVQLNSTGSEPPTVARRTLLDRLPSEIRLDKKVKNKDLASVSRIDGTPKLYYAIHQVQVSNGGLNPHQVANNVGLAAYYAGTYMSDPNTFNEMSLDSLMWPVAMLRATAITVNEHLVLDAMNDQQSQRFFISKPRVYLMTQYFEQGKEELRIGSSIDLLIDTLNVVTSKDLNTQSLADHRMWYGVMQAGFETSILEILMNSTGSKKGLLSASTEVGTEPVVMRSSNDSQLPESSPIALLDSLKKGDVVVLDKTALAGELRTWWTVSSDGTTRAILAPGLGGSNMIFPWSEYTRTNPYANVRTTYTRYTPDMSRASIQAQQQRAINEALGNAQKSVSPQYKKGSTHLMRVKRAQKLPATRAKSGNTEDSLLQVTVTWMLTPIGMLFGIVVAVAVITAFMSVAAYLIRPF